MKPKPITTITRQQAERLAKQYIDRRWANHIGWLLKLKAKPPEEDLNPDQAHTSGDIYEEEV